MARIIELFAALVPFSVLGACRLTCSNGAKYVLLMLCGLAGVIAGEHAVRFLRRGQKRDPTVTR